MENLWHIPNWKPVHCLVTKRAWGPDKFIAEIGRRTVFLKNQGLKAGDLVFVGHSNSLEFLADLFSTWALGASAAPLAPGLTRPEMENLVAFSKPRYLCCRPGKTPKGEALKIPILDLSQSPRSPETGVSFPPEFSLVLFTSGTTGRPKAVVHTKNSIEAKVEINLNHFGKGVFEKSLCLLSTHFVAGLFSNILTPLAGGGEVFLFPDPGVSGSARVGPIIDSEEITMMNTVPSLFQVILKSSNPPAKGTLNLVSVVSAPLNSETKAAIKKWSGTDEVFSIYGTTETGGWNTTGNKETMAKGNVGHILGGEAALLDEDGKIIKTGSGELLIKSPSVKSQYLNRPDLNRKAFIGGWFKTGDFAEIDDLGTITIKGRALGKINRAGIKIIPEEVESLLEEHPDIETACVFPYPDPVMGEGVAAAIEFVKGAEENFPALRNWCKGRARAVMIPEKWFRIDIMPRNDRGKIDRNKVRTLFFQEGRL